MTGKDYTITAKYRISLMDVLSEAFDAGILEGIAQQKSRMLTVEEIQDISEVIIAKRIEHISAQGVDCPCCNPRYKLRKLL